MIQEQKEERDNVVGGLNETKDMIDQPLPRR